MADTSAKGIAVVTGAGTGLGAALAVRMGQAGWDVGVHCFRSVEGGRATVDAIEAAGRRSSLYEANLAEESGALALAEWAGTTFGAVDVLINNAGLYRPETLDDLSEENWFEGFNSTASATLFTTKAFLKGMRARKNGRIINIGDGSCERPGARNLAMGYHVGKTGVWMLTRSFARSEAGHRIAVNMVSPGLLESSVGLTSPEQDGVPAGKYGTFDDVFEAVRFLAETDSTYLTGANLTVGGGWNL